MRSELLSVSLGGLSAVAELYAKAALAPNTLRTYRGQWRAWETFALKHGHAALPAAPEAIANWLAERASSGNAGGRRARRRGQSITTLRTAVASLKAAHLAAGLRFETEHPAIGMVLRGALRLQVDAPQQAPALRREQLTRILRSLGPDMKDRRDAALLALGYCFALRRSELVGLDLARLGDGTGVLSLHEDHLEVRLAHSKTGRVQDVFVLPRRRNQLAVMAIEGWLTIAGVATGRPVLRRVLKSSDVTSARLDAQSVSLTVKRRIAALSADRQKPVDYSSHSLRVGFATSAAEAGADIGSIQRSLGHRTTTMAARYSEAAHKVRTSPLQLPGAAIDAAANRRRSARPAIETPGALRRAIKPLQAAQKKTAMFEGSLQRRARRPGKTWYRDQKEHWLGWLAGYDGPGAYQRKSWDRSAAYIYSHVRCPAMLLWLAEAAGCPRQTIRLAARRALSLENDGARCAAIRAVLPWPAIEQRLQASPRA
ncbi:MAG: tyrosine-type recombinase/integrase [Hyphomicrobiaceae bacterium]|nr:tyrosine-type recombinase/integrase [Hyphomicrobiaceae bacterium]